MRLIEKMTADAQARIDEILAGARKQAAEIDAETTSEIERLEKVARLATEKRLDLEKARHAARIFQKVKAEEARLKRDMVEAAFAAARKQLDELGDDRYGKLFVVLAEEGLSDLGRKVTISVRDGDKKRAEEAVKKAGATAEVEVGLDGQGGGLVIRTEDGSIYIDNTLHGRLERCRIDGVTTAGRILFGGGAKAAPAEAKGADAPKPAEKHAEAHTKKPAGKKKGEK